MVRLTEEQIAYYAKQCTDYVKARELGVTSIDRWNEGISHHPMSERIMDFLKAHDFIDYDDYFCWKSGGDGDNGENLMYELDAFFEMIDKTSKGDGNE